MNFIRKKGFQLKTPPQIVGEVCLELEKEGRLTAKNLVDVSRDKDAPLHNEFEWSDDIAAEKYREVQAGYIIRSVEIEISSASPTITRMEIALSNAGEQGVRYFHATGEHGFDSLETISKDDEKYHQLMAMCIKDIRAFRKKYILLQSVMPELFRAIDDALTG